MRKMWRLRAEDDCLQLLPLIANIPAENQVEHSTCDEAIVNPIEPACHETILLVDDEPQIRDMPYQILTRHGYYVIQAVDGQDALEKFKQNTKGISMVVTDILMPRMDGVSSLKAMSSIDPSVKTLFMTGYVSDQPDPKAPIIIKPLRPAKILQTIRAILEGPQVTSSGRLT